MRSLEERAILRQADAIKSAERKASKRERRAKVPAEKRNRGREVEPAFLQYIRRQPCEARHMGGCEGPVQAAHIRYRDARYPNSAGAQVKNHDRHANPLCDHHHNHDQHKRSERRFWESIGKDAYATAAEHYATYKGREYLAARG